MKATRKKTELFISEYDRYLLQEGTHLRAYEKLGAHLTKNGVHFAVWAPGASRVSVVGNFNDWDGNRHPMASSDSGIWTVFIPGLTQGMLYKYEIHDAAGYLLPLKSDPYGFYTEKNTPAAASIIWKLPKAAKKKLSKQTRNDPISIYEVHLGSWKRGENNRYLTYAELGDTLVPYVKEMGFTHLELMPVSEYPYDGSWGYQPIGLFAPTSRYGTPDEFKLFIDKAHKAGLRVLIDWVPGHFPMDIHGLSQFDGSHLYEHQDKRLGLHQDWGTLIYNYGRTEVANFLISNAFFWMECYGIDGLRVDAVASMIYRNYSRKEGEWEPNIHGGVENLEATSFLRRMNKATYANFEDNITVAEESTAWPGVSRPTSTGGLGFGFKWNMGWMHDTLDYISKEPIYRKYEHHKMTFGLLYAYSENFILPISHDEVVHGKGSLLGRMPGDEWQRFANLRSYFGFMFGHPGKKLLFMGCEFGQAAEWNYNQSLDWHLLEYKFHQGAQQLIRDLNHLYISESALHYYDCEEEGFEWLESGDAENSVYAFMRRGKKPEDLAIVICNFTPVIRYNYRIALPQKGFYREAINTDSENYGGSNVGNQGGIHSEDIGHYGRPYSLSVTLPPLATLILMYQP